MHKLNSPTVVVRKLSKTFRVNKEGSDKLLVGRKKATVVEAVKPMSFAAYGGESVGIIGQNGSGKSTLLSVIAGNEAPTSGEVYVSSQPALLSVAAALQPHLSGVDNVRLGLLAKGIEPTQVDELIEPVANWSDIGDAIYRPISTYSSGMAARLKFAIATQVRPEILLVDEALATGDSTFNARAQERMDSFLNGASTVFIVSHSPGTIERHCTRALWVHEGELIADMRAPLTVKWYNMWATKAAAGDRGGAAQIIRRMQQDFIPSVISFDREVIQALDEGI